MEINKQCKLDDICLYIEGYVNPPVNENIFFNNTGMPWIKVSDLIHGSYVNSSKHHLSKEGEKLANNSSQIFKKGTIVWSKSGTIGVTSILNIDVMANRGILNIKHKKDKVLNVYLFYFLCKNKTKFSQKGIGAVLRHFYGSNLMNENINLPNITNQQQIIDIIEPLEHLKKNLLNQLDLFSKYTNFIINDFSILEKMNKKSQFLRGETVNNFSEGRTLFLNVAAANGNPNKYCDNNPNIFYGDVTLSLDGNTGLVNNNLLGFNGYLYKVQSTVIPNWQIYYSLKHKINQKIIKLNDIGTTIKHSSNSKKELLLLNFKAKEILEKFFDVEIILKKLIELIDKQIKNLISILIK